MHFKTKSMFAPGLSLVAVLVFVAGVDAQTSTQPQAPSAQPTTSNPATLAQPINKPRPVVIPATPHPLQSDAGDKAAEPAKQQPYFQGVQNKAELLGGAGTANEAAEGNFLGIRVGYGAGKVIRDDNGNSGSGESGWVFDKSTISENRDANAPGSAAVTDDEDELEAGPAGIARTYGGGYVASGSEIAPDAPQAERDKIEAATKRLGEKMAAEQQATLQNQILSQLKEAERDYYLGEDRSSAAWLNPAGFKKIWVQWECNSPQRITGRFVLNGSSISNLKRLGHVGDEVSTIRNDGENIDIFPTAPQTEGGFVFESQITGASILTMQLQGDREDAVNAKSHVIPLAGLNKSAAVFELPGGVRVWVRKDPLPAKLIYERSSMVFSPSETFSFSVLVDEIQIPDDSRLWFEATLTSARSKEVIATVTEDTKSDEYGQVLEQKPLNIELPELEGAYDLNVRVMSSRNSRLISKPTVLSQRSLQLLVVDPLASTLPIGKPSGKWELLREMPLEDVAKAVSKSATQQDDPDSSEVPTYEGSDDSGDNAEAASGGSDTAGKKIVRSLRVVGTTAARPHILELVCLGNEPANYEVSVARRTRRGLDAVVESRFVIDTQSEKVSSHRLTFWPTDTETTITITQSGTNNEKTSTRLRIYAGPADLPRKSFPKAASQRTAIALLDSPEVGTRFGVPLVHLKGGRKLGDWQYHLDSFIRSTQTINHAGYNTAMITVAGGGGSIYPSRYIAASTKYDPSEYLPNGAGSPRKDILELMYRVYDRERMHLIPTIRFDFPIEALESAISEGAKGVRLINEDGQSWYQAHDNAVVAGPYYNPLNPRVQAMIRSIVEEVAQRYRHHPSFAGLALVISDDTYLQLPDKNWGSDASTLATFEQFLSNSKSVANMSEDKVMAAWKAWRKTQLRGFLLETSAGLYDPERNCKLYVLDTVSRPSPSHEALRQEFSDPQNNEVPDLVWVTGSEIDQADRTVSSRRTETQMDLRREPMLPISIPLNKRKAVIVDTAPVVEHTGAISRADLVKNIVAQDPDIVVERITNLASGQFSSRIPVLAALQSLPVGEFTSISSYNGNDKTISLRSASTGSATYGYVTNNSCWPTEVAVNFKMSESLKVQASQEVGVKQDKQLWTARIAPYSMIAFSVPQPNVRIANWESKRDTGDNENMLAWCDEVRSRITAVKTLRLDQYPVFTNGRFQAAADSSTIPGWTLAHGVGIEVMPANRSAQTAIDSPSADLGGELQRGGVIIRTQAPASWPNAPIGWVRSESFDTSNVKRLLINAHVRASDQFQKSRVRMVVYGRVAGKDFQQAVWIDRNSPLAHASKDPSQQGLRSEQIALVGLSPHHNDQLQVIFELHGGGQVTIDQVEVFDSFFTASEIATLESMYARSVDGIERDDYSCCIAMKRSPMVQDLLSSNRILATPSLDATGEFEMLAGDELSNPSSASGLAQPAAVGSTATTPTVPSTVTGANAPSVAAAPAGAAASTGASAPSGAATSTAANAPMVAAAPTVNQPAATSPQTSSRRGYLLDTPITSTIEDPVSDAASVASADAIGDALGQAKLHQAESIDFDNLPDQQTASRKAVATPKTLESSPLAPKALVQQTTIDATLLNVPLDDEKKPAKPSLGKRIAGWFRFGSQSEAERKPTPAPRPVKSETPERVSMFNLWKSRN